VSNQRFVSRSGAEYRFVEQLGAAGGFGSVIRVTDNEGREYALKTLHFGLSADVLATEAENLERVEHENVVAYVDFGTDPEPFLIMELAEGGTLKDYLNEARQSGEHFPIGTLIEWARQMLGGLGAIHEVLLHRDLKPANVLLDDQTLKIADFGIARLAEASTREETFKGGGTAAYMPPEGWAGPDGPSPTPAYDLYSLGVTLFEFATLQLPFGGGRDELRHGHLYTEPPAPRSLRGDLPPQFERLILQLLRKNPSERGSIDTALELLETVEDQPPGEEEAGTSAVLTRLQEGASTLMREAAEREAEAARVQEQLQRRGELIEQAISQLDAVIEQAADVVERNVAPVRLARSGGRGRWQFGLQHSPRQVIILFGPPAASGAFAGNAPGEILLFGHVEVSESRATLGGANIVAHSNPEAPWVVRYQLIELTNQPMVMERMRDYEPFFLHDYEIAEHGRWLWGGAMHVYQPRQMELTVDVMVEWLARLMPGSA
jgi:tRNA A-37 threonylcarbamoyl transferase component Bud32